MQCYKLLENKHFIILEGIYVGPTPLLLGRALGLLESTYAACYNLQL